MYVKKNNFSLLWYYNGALLEKKIHPKTWLFIYFEKKKIKHFNIAILYNKKHKEP